MKKITLILILLFITGCATPYQNIEDTGGMGGYYHQRLGEDIFKVVFRGNGFTEYKRAYDFALLRAAEICSQLGYTYFVLEGQGDSTKTSIVNTGSTSYTSGSGYVYGNSASYYGTTQTYNNTMIAIKPGVELVVRYFNGQPTGRYLEVFEARSVIKKLSNKYNLYIKISSTPKYVIDTNDPNAHTRKIIGYRVDTSRKDKEGHFLKIPIYEDEKKK